MYIKLYQINLDRDVNRVAFEGMDYLNRFAGGNLDSSIYDLVYEGQVPDGVDPVSVTMPTFGLLASALPVTAPEPVMTLMTPLGRLDFCTSLANS